MTTRHAITRDKFIVMCRPIITTKQVSNDPYVYMATVAFRWRDKPVMVTRFSDETRQLARSAAIDAAIDLIDA